MSSDRVVCVLGLAPVLVRQHGDETEGIVLKLERGPAGVLKGGQAARRVVATGDRVAITILDEVQPQIGAKTVEETVLFAELKRSVGVQSQHAMVSG